MYLQNNDFYIEIT